MKYNYLDGFVVTSLLFYLYEEGVIFDLISGKGVILGSIDQNIIDILVLNKIIKVTNGNFYFTQDFSNNFSKIELGKILTLFGGYGENFLNLKNLIESKKCKRNFNYIGEGSNLSGINVNIEEARLCLEKYDKGVIIDLGCGTGKFIQDLGKDFPKLEFIGIDKSELSINQAKKENELDNVKFINGDIMDKKIYSGLDNVILINSFFVLHELIGKIEDLISFLGKKYSNSYFLLREFTPPKDLLELEGNFHDNFLSGYLMFHFLSGQETYTNDKWIGLFENYNYLYLKTTHIIKFNSKESLYPLLKFKIGK